MRPYNSENAAKFGHFCSIQNLAPPVIRAVLGINHIIVHECIYRKPSSYIENNTSLKNYSYCRRSAM